MSIENLEREQESPRFFKGNIKDFDKNKGYFIGAFLKDPLLQREDLECAIMELPVIDESKPHYHKLMYEVTFVLSGRLRLIVDQKEEINLEENEFLVIPPGTVLQNPENAPGTKVFVVKTPSAPGDKFDV
ncbi:cupin domain-containing protein [Candidatus Daviesbacteria bacterium]|nr:cupin domain-containing protein [Candidatus Daviesbacteria bacterium]